MCIHDSTEFYKNDCMVTPISNAFFSTIKRLAGCQFTPGVCPAQPNSSLYFTFCTWQSHFSGVENQDCHCRICVQSLRRH